MSPPDPPNDRPSRSRPVVELERITVVRNGVRILSGVDLSVAPGERWIVLGANGSGKSTLLAVAGLTMHPSSGRARLLGAELGRVDIRPLRAEVGVSSALLANSLRPELTAGDIVVCGRFGALEPWWHRYTEQDHRRAAQLLAEVGLDGWTDRTFGSLSSGERQRVLLARALFTDPALLLLDEPNAGLDPGAREALIEQQDRLAADGSDRATMLVTHHVEDIPASATHLLALDQGAVVARGPLMATLSSGLLRRLFGIDVELTRQRTRWVALPT